MLKRIELYNFKNHVNTVVNVKSSFSIVIGRNGSGKSALFDAVEWCLFHSKSADIRATSFKDLVNKSTPTDQEMAVQISLWDKKSGDFILLRREYNGSRTQMWLGRSKKLMSSEVNFKKVSLEQLQDMLQYLGIPFKNMNRVIIKQNPASIASASPKALLAYLEDVIGTDSMKKQMSEISDCIKQADENQKQVYAKYVSSVKLKKEVRLKLLKLASLHNDMTALYEKSISIFNGIKDHCNARKAHLIELERNAKDEEYRLETFLRNQEVLQVEATSIVTTLNNKFKAQKFRTSQTEKMLQKELNNLSFHKQLQADNEAKLKSTFKSLECKKKKLNESLVDLKTASEQHNSSKVHFESLVSQYERLKIDYISHIQKFTSENDTNKIKSEISHCVSLRAEIQELREEIEASEETLIKSSIESESMLQDTNLNRSIVSRNKDLFKEELKVSIRALVDAKTSFDSENLQLKENEREIQQLRCYITKLQCQIDNLRNNADCIEQSDQINSNITNEVRKLYQKKHYLLKNYHCCKELLLNFATATQSVSSHSEDVKVGMLIDYIQLKQEKYARAVITVLGASLSSTVVVDTRRTAIKLSEIIDGLSANSEVPNINIHIADEARSVINTKECNALRKLCPSDGSIVPIMDIISTTRHGYNLVLNQKLVRWHLMHSDLEQSSMPSLLKKYQQHGVNIVTLSGQTFLADGEMQSSSSSENNLGSEKVLCELICHSEQSEKQSSSTCNSGSQENADTLDQKEKQLLGYENHMKELMNLHKSQEHNCFSARLKLDMAQAHNRNLEEKLSLYNENSVVTAPRLQKDQILEDCKASIIQAENTHIKDSERTNTLIQDIEELTMKHECSIAYLKSVFRTEDDAERALNLLININMTNHEIHSAETRVRRFEAEIKRRAKANDKIDKQMRHLVLEHKSATTEVNKIVRVLQKSLERVQMVKEDLNSRDLSDLEGKIGAAGRQLKEVIMTIKKESARLKEIRDVMTHLSSEQKHNHQTICNTEEELFTITHRAHLCNSKSHLYNSCLMEDVFTSEILPSTKSSSEVTHTINNESFTAINNAHIMAEAVTTTYLSTNTDHLNSSDLRLLQEERCRFFSSEKSLHQHLIGLRSFPSCTDLKDSGNMTKLLLEEDTDFITFRHHENECAQHRNEYYRLHEKGIEYKAELHELSELRFNKLLTSLDNINHHLDHSYRELLPSCSCYLDYPRDRASLFDSSHILLSAEGNMNKNGGSIRFLARQKGDLTFREVGSLSGGQVAAIGLALLLSLQRCYPSPFFLMDEVDAALDTSTSCRVGCYLQKTVAASSVNVPTSSSDIIEKESAQFLLVSHRPEMQVWAQEIIGVYLYQSNPTSVSVCFEVEHSKDLEEKK